MRKNNRSNLKPRTCGHVTRLLHSIGMDAKVTHLEDGRKFAIETENVKALSEIGIKALRRVDKNLIITLW